MLSRENYFKLPSIITVLGKMLNKDIHYKRKCEPWSKTIKRKRFTFLEHLLNPPPETPVKKALEQYLEERNFPKI